MKINNIDKTFHIDILVKLFIDLSFVCATNSNQIPCQKS